MKPGLGFRVLGFTTASRYEGQQSMLGAALDSMFVPDSHKRLESLRQKHTRVAVALGGLHTEARIKAPELNFFKKTCK